ncbi:hypothetical protein A2U01_0017341, partial [Trifolium medium]|nr:hypothetical protein [Trifolium medium]
SIREESWFATRWPPFLRIHDHIARQASDIKQAHDLRVSRGRLWSKSHCAGEWLMNKQKGVFLYFSPGAWKNSPGAKFENQEENVSANFAWGVNKFAWGELMSMKEVWVCIFRLGRDIFRLGRIFEQQEENASANFAWGEIPSPGAISRSIGQCEPLFFPNHSIFPSIQTILSKPYLPLLKNSH